MGAAVSGHHRGVTQYETTGSGGAGERWNVNLPAVIGVVFVFLVGVIVWVIVSGGGDEPGATTETTTTVVTGGDDTAPTTTTTPPPETTLPETTLPETTLPETTLPATTTTAPVTTAPVTTVPVTTAPGAGQDAVPGDLAIEGRPMLRPGCDGSYITILASAVGDQATPDGIESVLDAYPNSKYLRTDQTCSSLRPDVDGAPIYVVYFGPFAVESDACAARAQGPEGAYAKQLSNDVPPDQGVSCG